MGATPDDNHDSSLVRQQVGVPDQTTLTKAADQCGIDQFTGPAGTALWFDANLLHGSGSNITPLPRSNLFLVFNSIENQLTAPFAAARPHPEYLAARAAVHGRLGSCRNPLDVGSVGRQRLARLPVLHQRVGELTICVGALVLSPRKQ